MFFIHLLCASWPALGLVNYADMVIVCFVFLKLGSVFVFFSTNMVLIHVLFICLGALGLQLNLLETAQSVLFTTDLFCYLRSFWLRFGPLQPITILDHSIIFVSLF